MGANPSKPAETQSPHLWKAPGATSMSDSMVEQLQQSSETDASRAQTMELQIQARVAEELRRIQAAEAANLKDAQDKLSAAPSSDPAASQGSPSEAQLTRHAVSKEVEALRAKLEGRKQVRDLPPSVEDARTRVIMCLQEHDRQPLNCYEEVVRFKEEVRRLEKTWVDKVTS